MTPSTEKWIRKAEGDYDIVCTLLRSRKRSRYDGICFHAQQCAEKYLKARLNEAEIAFPKTHDLTLLLRRVVVVEPMWNAFADGLKALTDSAVEVRYPDRWASSATAREMTAICRAFRRQRAHTLWAQGLTQFLDASPKPR